MSHSKRVKREINDDLILIESDSTTNNVYNEFCRHQDSQSKEFCGEYFSALCYHCNLQLCFEHIQMHRLALMSDRDEIVDQLNQRISLLDRWKTRPDELKTYLIENYQQETQKNLPFFRRLKLENVINSSQTIDQFWQILRSVQILLEQQQSVSPLQIEKLRKALQLYDEKQKSLINTIIESIVVEPSSSLCLFDLSKIDSPCRDIPVQIERASSKAMISDSETLLIHDGDKILMFNLKNNLDQNTVPRKLDWKSNIDGKILDLSFNVELNIFFILTEEKLFSFRLCALLTCLLRFTTIIWSCASIDNDIYLLSKTSPLIELYKINENLSSAEFNKQWNVQELIQDIQHLKCVRINPIQTEIAILADDDECRWRLLFFNMNMNLIRQSEILENASTLDWNLLFSYVNDRQTFIIDGTTENCYLLTVSNDNASIKRRSFSQSACPVSVCTITNDGLTQIIVKMIRPNTFRFFSV